MVNKRINFLSGQSFYALFAIICILIITPLSCYGQGLRNITRSDISSVKEIVGKMSLEEKLGQMFILGFDKERLPNEITSLITMNLN